MSKRRVALGFSVRTGRAIVVAVGGAVEAPEVLAKTRVDVATTFDEGAVFHMAQEMPIEKARTFVGASETKFVERARVALAAFVAELDAKIVGAALVAKAAKTAKPLPPIETILKVHPLVHAAEIDLYRRVFAEAAAAIGVRPARVAGETLGAETAAAVGLTPAKLAKHLATMGKASGRPWAADQKQAALAAWRTLAL